MGCKERRIKDVAQPNTARKKEVRPDSWIERSEPRSWRDPQSTQNQSGTASLAIIDETPNAERLDLDLAAIGFKSNLSLSVIPIPNTVSITPVVPIPKHTRFRYHTLSWYFGSSCIVPVSKFSMDPFLRLGNYITIIVDTGYQLTYSPT